MYTLDISQVISCTRFGRMKQKNGWEFSGFRKLLPNLIVFVLDGTADFCIDGTAYSVQANDILIIPSKTDYSANTETFCEYFFFYFNGEITKQELPINYQDIRRNFSFKLPHVAHDKIFFELKTSAANIFNKIYKSLISCTEYNASGTRIGQLLLDTEFLKILLMIGEMTELQNQSQAIPASLQKMIVYIKKNLTSSLSLSDICAACKLSPSYASRLFKKHLNKTVSEYVNDEKLYFACELIQSTNLSLSEIADYLGYSDVFYFSKLFKKKFGKAPSKYFS